MQQSNGAYLGKISKTVAYFSSIAFTVTGYWRVTYSVAPGVHLSLLVCDNGIGPGQARALGDLTLTSITGQDVMP